MKDLLALVGLLALMYFGLCWVGNVPPSHGRDVLASLFEQVALVLRAKGG